MLKKTLKFLEVHWYYVTKFVRAQSALNISYLAYKICAEILCYRNFNFLSWFIVRDSLTGHARICSRLVRSSLLLKYVFSNFYFSCMYCRVSSYFSSSKNRLTWVWHDKNKALNVISKHKQVYIYRHRQEFKYCTGLICRFNNEWM